MATLITTNPVLWPHADRAYAGWTAIGGRKCRSMPVSGPDVRPGSPGPVRTRCGPVPTVAPPEAASGSGRAFRGTRLRHARSLCQSPTSRALHWNDRPATSLWLAWRRFGGLSRPPSRLFEGRASLIPRIGERQQASRPHGASAFTVCVVIVRAYGSWRLGEPVSREGTSHQNERRGLNLKPRCGWQEAMLDARDLRRSRPPPPKSVRLGIARDVWLSPPMACERSADESATGEAQRRECGASPCCSCGTPEAGGAGAMGMSRVLRLVPTRSMLTRHTPPWFARW
jgi:hypothetical protein